MRDCYGVYARLSQQGEDEESVKRQVKLGIAWCVENGVDHKLYVEPPGARSGYYEAKRPEWKNIKRDLEANLIKGVVVSELARSYRNTLKQLQFIDWLLSIGGVFVSLRENIDPSTAAGKLMLTVISAANEWYRNDISERKVRQHKNRDKTIYASNRHGFGLKRTGKYPHIDWTTRSDELPTLVEACELYVTGFGTPFIEKELTRRGRMWRDLKNQPSPIDARTLQRFFNRIEVYKPFLDSDLYTQVIQMRESRRNPKQRTRHQKHPPLLLRGILTCEHCGVTFQMWHQKRTDSGRVYRYYRHRSKACVLGTDRVFPVDPIHRALAIELDKLKLLTAEQIDELASYASNPPVTTLDYSLHRQKLLERLKQAEVMRLDQDITPQRFREIKAEIEKELADIPEVKPPQPRASYAAIHALLHSLPDMLFVASELEPEHANLTLRSLVETVLFDGVKVRIKWADYIQPLEELLLVDAT